METMKLNFWVEWELDDGDKVPLRDNTGSIMYFSTIEVAQAAIKVHGIKGTIVNIAPGACGRKYPCSAHPGGMKCADCSFVKEGVMV